MASPPDPKSALLFAGLQTYPGGQSFFSLIGPELASQIEFVCSDMGKPTCG
jgi:hypothetical protein